MEADREEIVFDQEAPVEAVTAEAAPVEAAPVEAAPAEAAPAEAAPAEAAPAEAATVYTVNELVDGYTAFNRPKECVAAALKVADVKRAALDEARAIVEQFMRKVIK